MRLLAALFAIAILLGTGYPGRAQAGAVISHEQLVQADSAQTMAEEDDNDPLEGLNRGIFEFNRVVDGVFLKPMAQIYRGVLPQFAQDSVRSFLRNLRTPLVLVNDVLQGDIDRAGTTIGRFLVNSTLGILGLWDVASEFGMP